MVIAKMGEDEKNGLGGKMKDKAAAQVKEVKRKIKIKIIKWMIPVIATILIGLCVFASITSVIDNIKGMLQGIVNTFKVSENGIEITDEHLDQVINAMEASGIDFDDLGIMRRN